MLVRYAGVGLLINGIFRAVISFTNTRYSRENSWLRAESLVDFLFGIILLLNPLFSFIVFPLLIGPWILCEGILKIAASLTLKKTIRKWTFILTVGIISVVFGIVIIYDPFSRVDGIINLIGAFGVMMGTRYYLILLPVQKNGRYIEHDVLVK